MQLPLFIPNDTFPAHDLELMISCNSAKDWENKGRFYALKNIILLYYADEAGYDLQQIKRLCHSCYGTGKYIHLSGHKEHCHRCDGSGVWSIEGIVLKRWSLNGHLFHTPEGNLRYLQDKSYVFNERIKGLIEHCTPSIEPEQAWLELQGKYQHLWDRIFNTSKPNKDSNLNGAIATELQ